MKLADPVVGSAVGKRRRSSGIWHEILSVCIVVAKKKKEEESVSTHLRARFGRKLTNLVTDFHPILFEPSLLSVCRKN